MPALFDFDNTYARELSGLFVPWRPATAPAPRLLFLNEALADELRLDVAALRGEEGAALFAGNVLPEGAEPIAQAYAGHQFGGFSPQLGDGRALALHAHPGSVQDRDGAPPLLRASRCRWPFVALAFADAGYAGERVASASPIRIEIVRKPKGQVGFAVHARRWVVERFFSWIGRNRRLAKDFEASVASAEAFLYAASIMLLLRRLGRCT